MNGEVIIPEVKVKLGLQINDFIVNQDYLDKWNNINSDFVVLTFNGELIRNTLYRVGGMGTKDIKGKPYFMLLKYIEEYYDDSITKDKKRKPHLAGHWCILNSWGEEKVVLNTFDSPYLIKNSSLYTLNSKLYNIETGFEYGDTYNMLESKNYVFIRNDRDGVMQIEKMSGDFEIIN